MIMKKKIRLKKREKEEIMNFMLVFTIGILLIFAFVITFNLGGIDEQTNCKKVYGHWCNDYELSKMEEK